MMLLQYAEEQWLNTQDREQLSEVYALRAMIAARQENIPEAATAARRALEILPAKHYIWRGICQTVLAMEAQWLGHLQTAYHIMIPNLTLFRDAHEQNGSIILRLFLGELCLEQGALYKAEELFQTVQQEAQAGSNDVARALVGMAQLAYERNQLGQAQQQAKQAFEISTIIGEQPLQVRATLMLARIAFAGGQLQEASKMLQARLVYLDPSQFPQQHHELSFWQTQLEFAAGHTSSAQHWLETRHDGREQLVVSRLRQEQEVLLHARWLLRSNNAQDVVTLLEPWQQEAVANERVRSALEIGLVLSIAHHQLKQTQQLRRQLNELIQLAHTEGYVRLFLDGGEIVRSLLSAQLTVIREKALQGYMRMILQAFDVKQELSVGTVDHQALLGLLSPQERQVLRLLGSGMERQEIAEHLVVSLNTVKTHLQRLYQKLHVSNRIEAVEMARHLESSNHPYDHPRG